MFQFSTSQYADTGGVSGEHPHLSHTNTHTPPHTNTYACAHHFQQVLARAAVTPPRDILARLSTSRESRHFLSYYLRKTEGREGACLRLQ